LMASLAQLADYPWMDSVTLDLALTGARALGLGERGSPDLLAVGLSTLDAIGHDYGPDSREVHDHVVRLDRWLGRFMADIEGQLAGRTVLFVLSSDHGIGSMPEFLSANGVSDVGRIDLEGPLEGIVEPVQNRYLHDFAIQLQDGLVLADTVAMRSRGVDVVALGDRIAAEFRSIPGVARALTPAALASAPESDTVAGLWRRSIPASYGWLALAQPREGWTLDLSVEAEHGTPLEENVLVPVFFLAPGIAPARITRPIRTVDVAPTIAAMLGVEPTEPVDGHALPELFPDANRDR
jgi:arylsulfatase A-like enzyme